MGIWAVGPMPGLGQCMSIDTHALTALYHPRQIDKEATKLPKGFVRSCYQYTRAASYFSPVYCSGTGGAGGGGTGGTAVLPSAGACLLCSRARP